MNTDPMNTEMKPEMNTQTLFTRPVKAAVFSFLGLTAAMLAIALAIPIAHEINILNRTRLCPHRLYHSAISLRCLHSIICHARTNSGSCSPRWRRSACGTTYSTY